jgi:outer membrane protein
MRRHGRYLIGALLLMGSAGSALAAQSLLDSYEQALEGDPQLAAAQAGLRAQEENLAQARSLFLPQVGLNAGANKVWQDTSPDLGAPDSYSSNSVGIGLTQPLFRMESFTIYGQAREIIDQAEFSYALARQDLGLRVSQAYFRVLQANDALQSYDAELAAISRQLQRSKRAFEVGTATIADVNDAQARSDLVQARRLQALNEVQLAREALRRITGQPVGELARLRESFDPVAPAPTDPDAWALRAESDNLQVRLARSALEVAKGEVDRQRAQRYPRVDLVASYGRQNGVLIGPAELNVTQGTVGVQLEMPLYTGGAVSARIRQAQANKDQGLEQVRQAVRSASLTAKSAYLMLESSLQQVRALEQALHSMLINEQSTQRGVELGLRTTLDLLDIQRDRFAAERDLAAARYGYLLNYLQLQAAVGGVVTPEAVQAVNQFLLVE